MPSGPEIRELADTDIAAAEQLSAEAFGRAPDPHAKLQPGARYFGAFLGSQLAAKVTVRRYHSHFHGTTVATAGIGSVTVAVEHRGKGLLNSLLPAALAEARRDGAVVSALYPSALGIYRGFGYEHITECHWHTFDAHDLATADAPGRSEVRIRRAGLADVPHIRECYDRWGSRHNGPLTRRGPSFVITDQQLLDAFTAILVSENAQGAVTGYALWNRGDGIGINSAVSLSDLITDDAAARAALVRALSSFGMVAGKVRIRSSGGDVTSWIRTGGVPQVDSPALYMLSILDLRAAVATVAPIAGLPVEIPLDIKGRTAVPDLLGSYLVRTTDGRLSTTPTGDHRDPVIMTPGGLALWWSGAAGTMSLRAAGMLRGNHHHDQVLDAMIRRRPLAILDAY